MTVPFPAKAKAIGGTDLWEKKTKIQCVGYEYNMPIIYLRGNATSAFVYMSLPK